MTNEQFKERRTELGMTQTEIAEALGVSLRTAQYYEGCGGYVDVPGPVEKLIATLRPKRRRRKEVVDAV